MLFACLAAAQTISGYVDAAGMRLVPHSLGHGLVSCIKVECNHYMKSPAEHNTIQIELTSACVLRCSNCTRFCGTHQVPFFIEEGLFRQAIDSLVDYSVQPHALVGFMGGEPMLHPKFADFCRYAQTRIPREKLGLWSTFPDSPNYRKHAQLICDTFGNILLNDHSRDDILHAPVLMASEDYFKKE